MTTLLERVPTRAKPTAYRLAVWAEQLRPPAPEHRRSRRMAHVGGLVAVVALLAYLTWRTLFTLPTGGWNLAAAGLLIAFEALPLVGLISKVITLWNIDSHGPPPVNAAPGGMRVAVLIPTYNEPVEVIAPTIAAAVALDTEHETWVLDDGGRAWVAQLCSEYGARYICRGNRDHAKAGNLNHALAIMEQEAVRGADQIEMVAILDCDHVPLPHFLSATLGWFEDDRIALVQGPQAFYNAGAFDDDGLSGEQGLFFNVLMTARNRAGAGPFWCGSTSLLRVAALRGVGGVATETITEDMHTTLKLIRAGWRTAYHDQTLAVGLAPSTADQYLLQRRRWGLGAMQVLTLERLWMAKRWMSWRNFHEYLNGTLWWLEGIATLVAFFVPMAVLVSGAQTSTAGPLQFVCAFGAMFAARLWGAKLLLRRQIHWPTAFALRILRVPVGMACLWWLASRRSLDFVVTPKGGEDQRQRGRVPRVLWWLGAVVATVVAYAAAGTAGMVPWRTAPAATAASGTWLVLAGIVLFLGARRIRKDEFSTSRRNGHRVAVSTAVLVDDVMAELVDVSVGGVAVRLDAGLGAGPVQVTLPGARPVLMVPVSREQNTTAEAVSLRVRIGDWAAYRELSLWIFHSPAGAVTGLAPGVPVAAVR